MPRYLDTLHGRLELPAFFPDGTRGVVRSVDAEDVAATGTPGIVMNTYHLASHPGATVVRRMGGLHRFTGWDGPILTDSGGFQVYSLLRENPSAGTVRPNEVLFRVGTGADTEKMVLSPEKAIRTQFQLGADLMVCLDWCTHPDDPPETNRASVDTTIRWARACRKEFDQQVAQRKAPRGQEGRRPLLFGVIQGANDLNERRRCAEALLEIGFDGFGFGGWPLDGDGRLLEEVLAYTASLMPDDRPKYGLGIGKPENLAVCARMGYTLFDTVIPTRDARHKRLYVFRADSLDAVDLESDFYANVYMQDDKHVASDEPVSAVCDCLLCRRYSRGYLHHLFKVNDTLAFRLATIHNLRFYSQLMERVRSRYGA